MQVFPHPADLPDRTHRNVRRGEGVGAFLRNGTIIRNISVKEFQRYIRCEANRFLEKWSTRRDLEIAILRRTARARKTPTTHDSETRRGNRSGGGSRGSGRWKRGDGEGLGTLCLCQVSDGNRPPEHNEAMETRVLQ